MSGASFTLSATQSQSTVVQDPGENLVLINCLVSFNLKSMKAKKLFSLAAFICALLCFTFTHGQERLWGYTNYGIGSVSKDGSDDKFYQGFNDQKYGYSISGMTPLPNGEIFLSTYFDGGNNFYGRLNKIGPDGMDTLYQRGYSQNEGNYGMTVGNDGKVYVPYQGSVTIKLYGVLTVDPNGGSIQDKKLYSQPFSADYYLTNTPDGIYGISRGNSTYKGGIFKLNLSSANGYTFVYQFTGGTDGSAPTDQLYLGADGYLFGKTLKGGLNNKGIYFKVKSDGTSFTKLFDVATGKIESINSSGKFQRLLDMIGVGYLPLRDSEGFIFANGPDGVYKIGNDGFPIIRVSDMTFPRMSFVTPSFQHVVKVNNIADDAVDQPTSMTLHVNAFRGTNSYDLQISTTSDFSTIVQQFNSATPTFNVEGLQTGTDYYVRARPDIYPYWGAVKHFTTTSSPLIINKRLWTFAASSAGSSALGRRKHSFMSTIFVGNNRAQGALPLSNGEKIFISAGDGTTNAGEIWKLTAQGLVKLYDIMNYPEYAYINETMIEGNDGYVYALNFSVITPEFIGIIRFKTDGSSYERYEGHKSALLRYSQIAKTSTGIYGTSPGSTNNKGFIFKLGAQLGAVDVIHNFTVDSLGIRPEGELMEGRDGDLYGTTRTGGKYNQGVIFKIGSDGSNYTVLHHFQGSNGKNPEGKLVQDNDGWIFGSTRFGGPGGSSVAFKIFEDGTGFKKLLNFGSTGGRLAPIVMVDEQYVYIVTNESLLGILNKEGQQVDGIIGFGPDIWFAPTVANDTYINSIENEREGSNRSVLLLSLCSRNPRFFELVC
jgi:uncharacterized repeat protein (TIGR03803 family)